MKKIYNTIIIILISIIYLLFVGNYIINKNLYATISSTFTGKRIASNIVTAVFNKVPGVSIDKLATIQADIEKSPYIDSISKKYIDAMVVDIKTGEPSKVDISYEMDEIVSSLGNDFSKLELFKIKHELESSDINSVYEYSFNNLISNNGSFVKNILKIYNITSSYKYLFYVLLVVLSIVLFIINAHNRLKIFGICFGCLGLSNILFIILDKLFLEKKLMFVLKENSNIINIDMFYILTPIFVIISIVFILLFKIKE